MKWQDFLVCPNCLRSFRAYHEQQDDKKEYHLSGATCTSCKKTYNIEDGVAIFSDPPDGRREWLFERNRYDNIASIKPESWGLNDSKPETRTNILKTFIDEGHGTILEVGSGFGQLAKNFPDRDKILLEQSRGFIEFLKGLHLSKTWLVEGWAEHMPLRSNFFGCVVSDSVFQTVTDQKEFLFENARVLAPNGTFLLATSYEWNYPRKPQSFPASDHELIIKFLCELGIEAKVKYYDLKRGGAVEIYDTFISGGGDVGYVSSAFSVGDYLVIEGTKKN